MEKLIIFFVAGFGYLSDVATFLKGLEIYYLSIFFGKIG